MSRHHFAEKPHHMNGLTNHKMIPTAYVIEEHA